MLLAARFAWRTRKVASRKVMTTFCCHRRSLNPWNHRLQRKYFYNCRYWFHLHYCRHCRSRLADHWITTSNVSLRYCELSIASQSNSFSRHIRIGRFLLVALGTFLATILSTFVFAVPKLLVSQGLLKSGQTKTEQLSSALSKLSPLYNLANRSQIDSSIPIEGTSRKVTPPPKPVIMRSGTNVQAEGEI